MADVEKLSPLLKVLAELLRRPHEVLQELPYNPQKRVPVKCGQSLDEVGRHGHG